PHRIAGVSSFGFGGTNAHAVLRGVDSMAARRASAAAAPTPHLDSAGAPQAAEQAELVLLSAGDEASLRRLAARTAEVVGRDASTSLAGIARAWAARTPAAARLALVAETKETLVAQLRAFGAGELPEGAHFGVATEAPRIAFMYPGQGAQRVGMLAGVVERFPVVGEILERLEAALADRLEIPLTHLLYPERRGKPVDPETAAAQLTATEHCQPAMLAVGLALTRLLETVGVTPSVVTGHSLGEFTAAAAAGVFSYEDAARFVADRGRAMAALDGDRGAMAALTGTREEIEGLLVDGAVMANFNHPRQIVVSGETDAVAEVVERARAAGIKATPLAVSHGFHSPVLDRLETDALVDRLELSDPKVPVASGIQNHPYADAEEAREVFRRHATHPVDFLGALAQCRALGADLYLQVGAGGPLAAFARGGLPRDHKGILSLAGTDDHDGGKSLLETLARLFTLGVDLDPRPITAEAPLASLPPIVLPREPYWAVKDERQLAAKFERSQARAPAEGPGERTTAQRSAAASPGGSGDEVADGVRAAIAKASAYPVESLKGSMSLVDDLGFDSLMVADLLEALRQHFPQLGGLSQELFARRPTVDEVVAAVRGALGEAEAEEIDDDAPLARLRPTWVPAPLPEEIVRAVAGRRVWVRGPDAALGEALTSALEKAGAVHTVEAPELLFYCASFEDPAPVPSAAAGEIAAPDPTEDFLSQLRRVAAATPDVIVARRSDDPWAEGIAGAVRALRHEWPQAAAKVIGFAPGTPASLRAETLLREWASPDRSVDVSYEGTRRHVAGLLPFEGETAPRWQPGPGEVVLVTGGTRGIGAKLALRLHEAGATVLLVGRSTPQGEAGALVARSERAHFVRADVTDLDALRAGLAELPPVTALVHAAGLLADGPLAELSAEAAERVRAVKVQGWLNALQAVGPTLKVALAIGSWAGRFGNRHQVPYAAANALLSAVVEADGHRFRTVVSEFGPWTDSEMAATIPEGVKAAMRAEGVDFVGDEAGLSALLESLESGAGAIVHGRRLPKSLRDVRIESQISTDSHPYLLDHALEGRPVLPLAAATDLLAAAGAGEAPFAIEKLTLYQGVVVETPRRLEIEVHRGRAELRADGTLAYAAEIDPCPELPRETPLPREGGKEPELSLSEFYDGITFHGPMLQGIVAIDAVGPDFVRGRVRRSRPAEWIPGTERRAWAVDPLALDSAMQLSAYVAWTRFGRAGTPVGFGRHLQLRAPKGEVLTAEVVFGASEGDRFTGTIRIWDEDGALVSITEDVAARLVEVAEAPAGEAADEASRDGEEEPAPLRLRPEWTDPALWPEVKDLEARLSMAEASGIRNPYFVVHEGTAKNTSVIAGETFLNFSSYNYIGLSGDPRILERVTEAVQRYGTSVSASRVASGERPFHGALERELAEAQGAEAALVFTAGHATNVNTIGHLFGEKDLILHDELIHDSALQGIKLSGAARRGYRHEDMEHLERQLRELRGHYEKCLIVAEGVYSMDGDLCDLPRLLELKKKYGCMLMIDEAHSFGVVGATGRGVAEHFGIDGREVDIWMGTLSKSLASCGGWIAGSETLVRYLRYTAPGFVYSAGLTPANGVAALEALRLMRAEPERVRRLQENARIFHDALKERGIDTGPARGESGVVPAITGNSMHALMLSQRLFEQRINVQPILYPAVPDEQARLRFFLSSTHTPEELLETAEKVARTLEAVRADFPA
ncbi:MAG: aminotransferase class I/II-fold pyridoxal phosphate-dependent enzyme, partial [Deltaproteobacteria bacterium]